MKKALLGVAVALAFGLAGTSDAAAQGITLGVQGGYNYAQLSDVPTDIEEVGDKGSFVVGAFVDIQFHSLLFIGVEGMYAESKVDITDTGETGSFKQAYIDVPVYLGARLLHGMFQPVLYAGGMASFEASCDITIMSVSASCSDVDISTKSAVWSAVFGGGLDVALGPVRLNGDIRYNLGLSNVLDEDGEDIKWNSWMGLIGIGFGIG
jgi:hypothetical protein